MSWFFGRKKNKDSPSSDSGEEASPSSIPGDDYVVIEKPFTNPSSIMSGGREGDSSMKLYGSLYPDIGDDDRTSVSRVPMFPTVLVADNSQLKVLCDSQTYLNCIKFGLNKKFEGHSAIDVLQVDEILSFILRMSNEKYDYDFSLENTVVNEMINDGM